MAEQIRKGTEVSWKWGRSKATGKVASVHKEHIERTIKGEKMTRNGTENNPALEIHQDDGTKVLKLRSEVERA